MPIAQRQEFLRLIVSETERLTRLVNQVLDLAKIEAGHAEWRSADVDLVALCRQAALTVQELLHSRGAELVLDLPPADAPALRTLRADPDRLVQVLLNLLSNAAKFVPSPGGLITLRLRGDADGVTMSVQDNGSGIPPAQRALVFDKFRQGGDASNRPSGTGLGLPISRQIVEHFGGRLELAEQAPDSGQGACFVISLPWTHAATEPPPDDGDKPCPTPS
jgi:signal transduction histidine kinase